VTGDERRNWRGTSGGNERVTRDERRAGLARDARHDERQDQRGRRRMRGGHEGTRRRRWNAIGRGAAVAPARTVELAAKAARAALGLALAAALGLALAAMAACRPAADEIANGDDALAALAAPVESARYDGPYWAREAHRRSRTWAAARAYCARARAARLPNCHAVELVERWEGLGTPPSQLSLPPLAPPPPAPPALHPGEPGRAAADLAAVKAWEEGLAARARDAAAARRGR
jgi:hypothetical protein